MDELDFRMDELDFSIDELDFRLNLTLGGGGPEGDGDFDLDFQTWFFTPYYTTGALVVGLSYICDVCLYNIEFGLVWSL